MRAVGHWLFHRHWTTVVGGLALLMSLAMCTLGGEQALVSNALEAPLRAQGTVVKVNAGGDFMTKDPTYVKVEFTPAGGTQRHVRIDRVERPLPHVGERYEIDYGQAKFFGLVAQQAGYEATFARTWGLLIAAGCLAALGITLPLWHRFGPIPDFPPDSPPVHPGVSHADYPDWSHRTGR